MPGLMNEEHTFLYDYAGVIPQTVTISSYTTAHEQLRLSSDSLTKVMNLYYRSVLIQKSISKNCMSRITGCYYVISG